ncbi:MAG: chemotaxis protein CheD [Candidatus Lambdaproteobacteria bacterium]|nr:chemotaxis protein CheD [Candidatus Lambdaproteobacteria bacterium]
MPIATNELTRIAVGVSDMKVSADPHSYLVTYSLGSCIGVVMHDPASRVAGLLHFQLPDSKGHEQRAANNPHMFADTGIPLLFSQMQAQGARRERLVLGMFGGASMLDDQKLFKIGIKNTRAAKKILWQNCVSVKHEDVGGSVSRTISVEVATGRVTLKSQGQTISF